MCDVAITSEHRVSLQCLKHFVCGSINDYFLLKFILIFGLYNYCWVRYLLLRQQLLSGYITIIGFIFIVGLYH